MLEDEGGKRLADFRSVEREHCSLEFIEQSFIGKRNERAKTSPVCV